MSTIAEKWFQGGIEKGIEKGKCDAAIQLIKMGMNNEVIHNATGFGFDIIEELRKTNTRDNGSSNSKESSKC
jgi:hypothetical protein